MQSRPPPSDEQKKKKKKMMMMMMMMMMSTKKGLDEEWFLLSCRSAFERPRTMKSNQSQKAFFYLMPEKKSA